MRMEDRARKEALKVVLPYILMLLAPILGTLIAVLMLCFLAKLKGRAPVLPHAARKLILP